MTTLSPETRKNLVDRYGEAWVRETEWEVAQRGYGGDLNDPENWKAHIRHRKLLGLDEDDNTSDFTQTKEAGDMLIVEKGSHAKEFEMMKEAYYKGDLTAVKAYMDRITNSKEIQDLRKKYVGDKARAKKEITEPDVARVEAILNQTDRLLLDRARVEELITRFGFEAIEEVLGVLSGQQKSLQADQFFGDMHIPVQKSQTTHQKQAGDVDHFYGDLGIKVVPVKIEKQALPLDRFYLDLYERKGGRK